MTLDTDFLEEIDAAVEESVAADTVVTEAQDGVQDEVVNEDSIGDPGEGEGEGAELPADQEAAGSEEGTEEDSGGSEGTQQQVPAPVEISDLALTVAVQAGLSIQDARSFGSEEALLNVVGRMNEMAGGSQVDSGAPANAAPGHDPFADLPALDPEVYGEEAIKMFDALKKAHLESQEKINAQQAELASLVEYRDSTNAAQQEANAREVTGWFDAQVNDLGDDFADALGKGDFASMTPGSSQLANRNAVADQLAVLFAGYQNSGQQPPPRDQLFASAARLALPDVYKKISEKSLTSKLQKRAGQHIGRSGGKGTKQEMSPTDSTAAMLDEKYFKRS